MSLPPLLADAIRNNPGAIRNNPGATRNNPGASRTADSAPATYACRRPGWLAPLTLSGFALGCAALAPAVGDLTPGYAELLGRLGGVPSATLYGPDASLAFRPFFGLLLALLAVAAPGAGRPRLALGLASLAAYGSATVVVDALLAAGSGSALPAPLGPGGGLIALGVGVAVTLASVFSGRRLPVGVGVRARRSASRTAARLLFACMTGGLAAAVAWTALRPVIPPPLAWIPLAPTLVFLLTTVALLRAAAGAEQRALPRLGPTLSVGFLIPAHNEAHAIAASIASLDRAAARSGTRCAAYVVDNASTDATAAVAGAALAECRHLTGDLLTCPVPGKANALNSGLRAMETDIVVRVDADTYVTPEALERLMPWFWDRSVGGVGGLPLPKRSSAGRGGGVRAHRARLLRALQVVEFHWAISFLRAAQSAVDGTTVMPGSIAAYRRPLLVELGGFGTGFNGEDGDVTLRLGRLGYRMITDASVRVRTECPSTLGELREQRQRWTRGKFHSAARNLAFLPGPRARGCPPGRRGPGGAPLWTGRGVRGFVTLPWSVWAACRRCLLIPLLLGGAVVELVEPAVLTVGGAAGLARLVVAGQLLGCVAVLVARGELRALPAVVVTPLYRLVLGYFAFETLLTMTVRERVSGGYAAPDGALVGPTALAPSSSRERGPNPTPRRSAGGVAAP